MTEPSVLFVITEFGPGGAETQILRVGVALRARGWKVNVLSLLPPVGFVSEASAHQITVHTLGMSRGEWSCEDLSRARDLVAELKPRAMVGFLFHANVLVSVLRPLLNVERVLISLRGQDFVPARLALQAAFLNIGWADELVTNSANLKAQLSDLSFDTARTQVVPNLPPPIAYSPKNGGVQDRFLWLAVGNLLPAKDFSNLLHAFSELSGKAPSELWIAGAEYDRSEAKSIKALIVRLGLEKSVRLLGRRGDVPALLKEADGFVLSSWAEGLPNVVIEGMLSGTPVVATDVGGVSELVIDSETGRLVSAKNPHALAEAMKELMSMSPQSRKAMCDRAYEHVSNLCRHEELVDRWEALLSG